MEKQKKEPIIEEKLLNEEVTDEKEIQKLQKEALATLDEYLPRLIETSQTVAEELAGDLQDDTHDLFNQIIDGINYTIEVFNGTLTMINKERINFNTDELEDTIQQFSAAIIAKDDALVAERLQNGMLPFLQKLQVVIKDYL